MDPMDEDARICVVLVEDHPSSAEGLALGLGTAGFGVLAMVADPAELDGLRPDVVLSDLHLGDVPVRETMTALAGRGLRVLAISGPATPEEVLDAIDAGAQGFVDKTERTSVICAAAAEVAGGGCWIGPKLAGYLLVDAQVRPLRRDDIGQAELGLLRAIAQGDTAAEIAARMGIGAASMRALYARILDTARRRRRVLQPTPRQREVMILIARRGMTQRRAAAELGISEATVAEHLQNIKETYLRTHPGARADTTPVNAARLLAEEHGL
jgi:DNA-binding NarL/FixJ family response regulator